MRYAQLITLFVILLIGSAASAAPQAEGVPPPPGEDVFETQPDVISVTPPPVEHKPLPEPKAAAPSLPAGRVVVLPEAGYRVQRDAVLVASRLLGDAYAHACQLDAADTEQALRWREHHATLADAMRPLAGRTVLSLELIGLDDRILVTAARYEPTGNAGAPVAQQRLRVDASGFNELPVVTERLADSLCRNVSLEESQTYGTILSEEGRAPQKVFGAFDIGARLNVVMPLSTNVSLQPMLTGGIAMRWEAERFFLELGAGAAVPASGAIQGARSYGGVYADFGAAYFFYAQETGVYLGGGILPSLMMPTDGDFGVHIAPYLTLGMEFLRYSTARVVVDLRVAQHALPFESRAGGYWNETTGAYVTRPGRTYFPTEIQLGFSLLF